LIFPTEKSVLAANQIVRLANESDAAAQLIASHLGSPALGIHEGGYPSTWAKWMIARALGELRPERAKVTLPHLAGALKNAEDNEVLRWRAAAAMARIGEPSKPYLHEALLKGFPAEEGAALALGEIGDASDADRLIKLLIAASHLDTRRAAVKALCQIGLSKSQEQQIRGLIVRKSEARFSAKDLLRQMGAGKCGRAWNPKPCPEGKLYVETWKSGKRLRVDADPDFSPPVVPCGNATAPVGTPRPEGISGAARP
jgi:hypothetical protein